MTTLKSDGRIAVAAAVLLAALLLAGLGLAIPSLWRRAEMRAHEQGPAQEPFDRAAVPPLDAAAPAEFKTATFAMG